MGPTRARPEIAKLPPPTARQWLLTAALAAIPLTAVGGMVFSPHLASDLGSGLSMLVGALVGGYATWASRPGGPLNRGAVRGGRGGGWRGWMAAPVTGAFCFAVTFVAVEVGVLALVTAAIGRPDSRTVTVTGTAGPSRHSCHHFEIAEVWWTPGRALCTGRSLADRLQGRTLVLYGKGSPFGLNVARYELGPAR